MLLILTPIVAQSSDEASLIITAIGADCLFEDVVAVLLLEPELKSGLEPPPPHAARLSVKAASSAVRTARRTW